MRDVRWAVTRRALVLLVLLPLACRERQAPGAAAGAAPGGAAFALPDGPSSDDSASLRAYTEVIDSFAQQAHEELYAVANGQLVPVADEASFPELAEAQIRVLRAADGTPRRHVESPVSESGDWSVAAVHYFDAQGRTVGFALEASWPNSGCTEVLRDHRFMLYDARFRRRLEEELFLNADGQPQDTTGCLMPYEFDRSAFSNYTSLVAAGLAPAARP